MSKQGVLVRQAGLGLFASMLLLGLYFSLLTVISGWRFTVGQFSQFWYYVVLLALGFGLQVGLYARLRQLLHGSPDAGTVMAASGTTSTAAMLSCCAHYLVNILPVPAADDVGCEGRRDPRARGRGGRVRPQA
jgi:Cu+-exporting ATPase